MAKISVIVPVYKVESYVGRCIESLINQTFDNIEIILIDDGSPDGSGAICDEYALRDKRIKVIHQKNQGVSVARNSGLKIASGEWITFVDGDDWTSKEMCEEIIAYAETNNADVVIFSYYSAYENKEYCSKLVDLSNGDVSDRKDYIIKKTISQYYGGTIANNGVSAGTTWGKLIKKSLIDKYSISFKEGITRAQDTIFWLRGFQYADKICMYDKCLYYYRISNTSICSGTKYIPNCEIPFSSLINEYQKFIKDFHKDSEYQKAFDLRVMQVLLWHIKHKYFHENNNVKVSDKIDMLRKLCEEPVFANAIKRVNIRWAPKGIKVLAIFLRLKAYHLYYIAYTIIYKRKR